MRPLLALQHCKSALVANFQTLASRAGTATGAAIKADAYGLGVADVARLLLAEGCRDFFVSTWWEAAQLDFLPAGMLSVLHGLGPDDEPRPGVRPVLVTPRQVAHWRNSAWASEPCDVMVDTGMNRLGLRLDELECLGGMSIHTLHSHLACADEAHRSTISNYGASDRCAS
jgi:alanine racemase